MSPILLYILNVSGAFALFYIVYKLFLSTDTFFVRNRFYFLGAIVVALLAPLLKFKIEVIEAAPVAEVNYGQTMAYISEIPQKPTPAPEINYWELASNVFITIYLLGVVFYLVRLVWAYHKLIHLIITSERKKLKELILVITRISVSPFSLLKWLVVPGSQLNHPDFENIVQHESIHCRQYHSVDLFLAELLVVFQWFNPFAWWFKRSMVENHEFIVDQVILQNGVDPKSYQYSLLSFTTGSSQLAGVNYFNSNLLKKRICMMNKNKSPKWYGIKNISILISAAAVIAFTASFEKVAVAQNVTSSQSKSNPVLTESTPAKVQEAPQAITVSEKTETEQIINQPQLQINTIDELYKFMLANLEYPANALKNNLMGVIKTSFTIDKSGAITDISNVEPSQGAVLLKEISIVGYGNQQYIGVKSPVEVQKIGYKSQQSTQTTDEVQIIGYGKKLSGQSNSDDGIDVVEGIKLLTKAVESCLNKLPLCDKSLADKCYILPVNFKIEVPSLKENEKPTGVIIRKTDPASNETPLYIVNGEKQSSNLDFSKINSNDISKIQVIKDKSAITLYGDEGKNGVILITTKQPQPKADEKDADNTLIFAPNPASDNVEITLKGNSSSNMLDVQVFDSNGKQVFNGKQAGPTFTLPVAGFSTGIYLVVVLDNGKKYQGSLSVKH